MRLPQQRCLFLICLILSLHGTAARALDPHRALSQYLRDRWTVDDGFPGGQVSSIAQTPDGCLWIGGENGLVRFDGLSFRIYQESSKGVPIAHVLGLATDAGGGLWIWMQGANVLRYSKGSFENVTSGMAWPDGSVTAISQTGDGGVLLSTIGQETFEYRRGTITKVGVIRVPDTLILANAQTADGRIWAGTSDNGLFYLQAGRIVQMKDQLAAKKINVLLAGEHNTLWIGTDEGLFLWDGVKISNAAIPLGLRSDQIFTIALDRNGNLWVGTPHGLFRVTSSKSGTVVSTDDSEPATTALTQDREGDLWIGSPRGLERWRDGVFVGYPPALGFPAGSSGPLFAASDGRLWFGPASGGLYAVGPGSLEQTHRAGLSSDIVYSLSGSGADLWVGRQRGGLTHLYGIGAAKKARTYTTRDGLAQDSVYAVQQTADGAVWAGTLSAGLSVLKGGSFRTYRTADGLASNTITAIEEDARHNVWIATPDGLSGLIAGRWRTYGTRDGLPSQEVTALLRDPSASGAENDTMWIGTSEGLALLISGRLRSVQCPADVLRAPILGLAVDQSGFLWIATPQHILRVNREKLRAGTLEASAVREYNRGDGLLSQDGIRRSRSMVIDENGRVWISTRAGLVATDPQDLRLPPVPVVVQIKAILADGRSLRLARPRIPASQQRITVEFTGVSLSQPGRVRFRYRLDGFDKSWSEPTAIHEAVYTHLDPGRYRFHVIASNSDGVWNTADVSLPLVIPPAAWQTWWFRLCFVAVAMSLVWWIYLLRMQSLAGQLQLRFEERLAERMRIAQDLHDTLLQGFLSASLQLDVAADFVPGDSPAAPLLSRVLALMHRVSEDCRSSLMTLRTVDRPARNLEDAFSRIPHDAGLEYQPEYRIIVNGSPRRLDSVCADEVFLIGREAVINAHRHAHAILIEVELVYERTAFRLSVRDDGRGIDEAIARRGRDGHFGLTGMRERAVKLGARFRVWSRPEQGTEIEVVIPGTVAYVHRVTKRLPRYVRNGAPEDAAEPVTKRGSHD